MVKQQQGTPEVLPITGLIKHQIQHQRLADDRSKNLLIFNVREADMNGGDEKDYFMSIVSSCGLQTDITENDVLSAKRIAKPAPRGQPAAAAQGGAVVEAAAAQPGAAQPKTAPILVTLSREELKTQLFKKLGRWRDRVKNERDPNDKAPLPAVEHDLTVDQRRERRALTTKANELFHQLEDKQNFRVRVRGPPCDMKVVKIDTRTGRWETLFPEHSVARPLRNQ